MKMGQFALKNAQEDQGMVTHDRKSPKRDHCSTSFDCS